ncbi:alpha/beta hydrolase-fold protein [Acidicapsa dinghuensis]|uniref:Alpha/beta hydrolase-fold protein n=1 Tax=Acidicapsa dinghuensis TaxID=2218256 RepID=A0ABW1EJ11_9BACT|nr:alpha/beta hydrolase-fold protein [Acidicapsa dinghuensis]
MYPLRRAAASGCAVLAILLFSSTATAAPAQARFVGNDVRTYSRPKSGSTTEPVPETGFLNRTLELDGITYHFQIYLPEDFHRFEPPITGKHAKEDKPAEQPPIILFLHGRGERGTEGMWQTQIGLPQQLRDHPERWPFIVVMPQCPYRHFWTDPDMLRLAMATLDQETREFHADPDRTYLMGLSLGGYGAWELAKDYPHRWAAVAIASSGIFWSYAPERWREQATLPAEYAHRIGRTPIWLFHGSEDTTVLPRQSELLYDAFKAAGGHIRFWEYQGLHHDCWTRAFNEPELPRWLLDHRLNAQGQPVHTEPKNPEPQLPAFAEHLVIPLHPPALKLPETLLDTYVGEYRDSYNIVQATIQRQGEKLFLRNAQGDVYEILAETTNTFFYPSGSLTRLTFEHDTQGRITGILYRDDRHEELWERKH